MSEDRVWDNALHHLSMLTASIKFLEANSRKANTEQPLVGPPGTSNGKPAALARPAILAKLIRLVEDTLSLLTLTVEPRVSTNGVIETMEEILQGLKQLDQGPIAKRDTKETLLTQVDHGQGGPCR